ncbi:MAG: peptide/nickel transport system permease protein [Rhodospirillaceae bacterium]|nr:peptide/nickel transport system permease protein [Rhodospirillaceae bacterium]
MTVEAIGRRDGAILRMLKRLTLLRESPVGMIGAALVLFWIAVAILAPLIAPYDPNQNYMDDYGNWGPSAAFWLGRDNQGRDILSRIIWGSRIVLTVGPTATFCAYVAGCTMGLLAGYYRGWVDVVVSRISDIILSFPVIILYLIIISQFGPSALNIIIAVAFIASPQVARIVRGLTLELREREYVAAAKMRGESASYIMLVEILPNARGPLIVDACLRMGYTTIAIGVLGFLGLGLPPPDPDWGGMVKDTYSMMSTDPHMSLFPCAAISSLVVGFNLLADGLREISLRD